MQLVAGPLQTELCRQLALLNHHYSSMPRPLFLPRCCFAVVAGSSVVSGQ